MKSIFFFLVTILTTNLLLAQSENYKKTIGNFQTNYNAEKYTEIFNGFSPEMKQALPLEKAQQFLAGLMNQMGKIKSTVFVNYQRETYAMYKTSFEKAVMSVNISLDQQNQVNGFFVKPYEEPAGTGSQTVNGLNGYPEAIAAVLFSKARDFPNHTQLSVAFVQPGATRYYGVIKVNDTLKPIENQHHVFEIGSITKVFTSTVLAALVESRKISLTDEINSYYPFPFKDSTRIRFEQLANHTSGLPRLPSNLDLSNRNNPYRDYGRQKLDAYLNHALTLDNKTSAHYAYSNLGAGLLGYTLGLSQKTSFQQLLQQLVFDKYQMTNSFTGSDHLQAHLVKGLDATGKTVPNWNFDVLFGAGGIISSTTDLAKFARAQFDPENRELALTRKQTFVINENMKIGLGWHILKSKNGQDLYWHNGGTGGYSSSMCVDPENKTAVIVLSNVSPAHPKMGNIDGLCFALLPETGKP